MKYQVTNMTFDLTGFDGDLDKLPVEISFEADTNIPLKEIVKMAEKIIGLKIINWSIFFK